MNRKSLKTVRLVLAVVLTFFAFAPTAAAASAGGDETVARIYACSRMSGLPSLGHVWSYVQNVSDETIRVGIYDVPPGEGVSLGLFGLTRSDGFGVYYNVEAHCGNKYGLDGCVSISDDVSRSELEDISRIVLTDNLWDPMLNNCIFFAFSLWNAASDDKLFPVSVFPYFAYSQILLHSGKKNALTMYPAPADRVFKQRGFGSGAYLTVVSPGTLDSQVG